MCASKKRRRDREIEIHREKMVMCDEGVRYWSEVYIYKARSPMITGKYQKLEKAKNDSLL